MVYSKSSRYSPSKSTQRRRDKINYGMTTAGKALATASTALAVARGVKSLINVEKKFYDKESTGTVGTTMGSVINPLSSLAQGDTTITRDGDSIKVKSTKVRFYVDNTSNANTGSTLFRVIAFIQHNLGQAGNNLTLSDILEAPTDINSPYAMDKTGYKVFYDKTFSLGSSTFPAERSKKQLFIKYDKDFHATWIPTDTTGNNANQLKGNIAIGIMCDGYTTNNPTYDVHSRVRFIDN